MASVEWAAGYIDGDGSVGLVRQNVKRIIPSYLPTLSVHSTDRRSLDALIELFGGRLYGGKAYGIARLVYPSKQLVWRWAIHGQAAIDALEKLQPHLVLKGDQAWLVREAWAQMKAQGEEIKGLGRNGGRSPYQHPEEIVALREGYRLALANLNGPSGWKTA